MLKKLSVRNYVLIEELEIPFNNGLTIITGETGAGKSILLGALGLILGQRADSASLLKTDKKCIIEGTFDISAYNLKEFFTQQELDYENETSVRREITPEGKSRAFINDTPVTLNILREFSSKLVDIHSQHETLFLNSSKYQLAIVDAYAGNEQLLSGFRDLFSQWKNETEALVSMREQAEKDKADLDYFSFQFTELEQADLKPDEKEFLEQEQNRLEHAADILLQIEKIISAIDGNDENILSGLSFAESAAVALLRFDESYRQFSDRLKSVSVELRDICDELDSSRNKINPDPSRLEQIQERLSLIYRLEQKHRVNSVSELIGIRDSLDEKIRTITIADDIISTQEQKVNSIFEQLKSTSEKLSLTRKKVIPSIEKELTASLKEVAMPAAIFKINQSVTDEFTRDGSDKIQFLFSANKGTDYRELQKVASGGEMSRLMLCIKAMMARLTAMPTVIFDEIDTGISGETAAKTGLIMQAMGKHHQVIAITHLPQIASRGNSHLKVMKEVKKDSTSTRIFALTEEERTAEIARMLSGEKITEAALANARQLIRAN